MAGTGYRRARFVLNFTDPHPLAGLRIVLKSMSIGQMFGLADFANLNPDKITPEDEQQIRDLFHLIIANTVEWNLEDDDGKPVPIGSAAWGEVDFVFVLGVASEWMEAVGGLAAPLVESVNSGGTLPEVHIPMELPSNVPPSFARP